MADLSKLSTAELLALYQRAGGSTPARQMPTGGNAGRNEASPLSGPGGGVYTAPGAGYFTGAAARPKMFAKTEEDLLKLDAEAKAAQGLRSDVSRFSELNQQVGTGPLPGLPIVRDVLGAFDPRFGEMRALTEKITPAMREAGSGAMSDRDVQMYRASTVSVDKVGPTNGAIARAAKAGAQREGDYAAFRNEWAKRNNTLVGAQEAWQAYADANPLFEAGKTGTRVRPTTPWRNWFGLEAPAAARSSGGGVRSGAEPARTQPRSAAPAAGGWKLLGVDK